MEWRPENPYWVARVPGGHYAVERWDGGATLTSPFFGRCDLGSFAEAKSVAEKFEDSRTKS